VNAYLCVYCHKSRTGNEPELTREAAETDPLLGTFLDGNDQSYYDWGDDPSFFAAQHLLGDVRKASWGVCRPDVRKALGTGDVVIFFCACQRQDEDVWRYHFVGFGTVLWPVHPRADLWTNPAYEAYRQFYNVLARLEGGHMVQSETFFPYHPDWEDRAEVPYVLFDGDSSCFNLTRPHCVATWDREHIPETWNSDCRSAKIEDLLFVERGIQRRLRTSASGHPHPKLNLLRGGGAIRPGRALPELTRALRPLVSNS
jgi:hypothetical protein